MSDCAVQLLLNSSVAEAFGMSVDGYKTIVMLGIDTLLESVGTILLNGVANLRFEKAQKTVCRRHRLLESRLN